MRKGSYKKHIGPPEGMNMDKLFINVKIARMEESKEKNNIKLGEFLSKQGIEENERKYAMRSGKGTKAFREFLENFE